MRPEEVVTHTVDSFTEEMAMAKVPAVMHTLVLPARRSVVTLSTRRATSTTLH